MGKKRKSGGRSKGQSGRGPSVQCSKCGRYVPRDKAKKHTRNVTIVDHETSKMIRKQKGYVPRKRVTSYLCVSCAVHTGKVKIRARIDRK